MEELRTEREGRQLLDGDLVRARARARARARVRVSSVAGYRRGAAPHCERCAHLARLGLGLGLGWGQG